MTRWSRRGDGLEFDRIAFFTDAVFAIAMTLLIVAIAVPSLRHATSGSDLLGRLDDKSSEFGAFFIGFAVLGNYWMANHRFVGYLAATSPRFVFWNLVYLAFVAWLPFPTALFGAYERNPVAVGLFAVSAAIVSGLEATLFDIAQRDHLFRGPVPDPAFRHSMRASLVPVATFLLSVPVAFIDTYLAIAVWALTIPGELLLDRAKPDGFDEVFAFATSHEEPGPE